jgi:hypothetical protein
MKGKAIVKHDGNGAAITPMQEISREVMLRKSGDEDFRYQTRKLANIHLGVTVQYPAKDKKTKQPLFDGNGNPVMVDSPKATDYFVLPERLLKDLDLREALEALGEDPEKPTRLPIMLMSNAPAVNIVTSRDCYGAGEKLKCRSYDGRTCTRLNDQTSEYEPGACDETKCPLAVKGDCDWYHRLRFLMPDAAGLGYYQIATQSDNNRGALVREMISLRKALGNRIAGADLALVLTNERTFHYKGPDGKLHATAPYLLHLDTSVSLRKLINAANNFTPIDGAEIEESFDMDHVEAEPVDAELDAAPQPWGGLFRPKQQSLGHG